MSSITSDACGEGNERSGDVDGGEPLEKPFLTR
jgi:hypothetical protein